MSNNMSVNPYANAEGSEIFNSQLAYVEASREEEIEKNSKAHFAEAIRNVIMKPSVLIGQSSAPKAVKVISAIIVAPLTALALLVTLVVKALEHFLRAIVFAVASDSDVAQAHVVNGLCSLGFALLAPVPLAMATYSVAKDMIVDN